MANNQAKPLLNVHTAHCFTCGKEWSAKNALSVGTQHARKHGHFVSVNLEYLINGERQDSAQKEMF